MLKIDQLQVRQLPPLTFEVDAGACLAIEGPSGSGKTVLLRAIADLDATEGQVFLDGVERQAMTGAEWRKQVRFVAAEARWWEPTARPHFADVAGAYRLLVGLGLDSSHLDRPLDVLSTGERQRLAFARALCDNPPVLLLDEPTSALDAAACALVEREILARLDAGVAVLIVSHDSEQIERLSDARLQLGPLSPQASARAPASQLVVDA
ncbi:MAG: ATP-binding cassette domain-containing protein [Hyphomicrobiaceae bacterium]|nr:ATP-binding cassette domain-containing protein [Hyphomicrobiaceae bacterium]